MMNEIMRRRFMPIGQGGFAVEQFDSGESVVFDCGTVTNAGGESCNNFIEDRIIQAFPKERTTIQKVFISHFHKDHINGLPYLLNHYIVNEVYMPYLTPSEQVITLILMHKHMGQTNASLFQNLITGRGIYDNHIDTRITYVVPSQNTVDFNQDYIPSRFVHSGEMVETGDKDKQWVFIPFTFDDENRTKHFNAILDKYDIGLKTQKRIRESEFWKDKKIMETIRAAYKDIEDDINLTNMTVYSGKLLYDFYDLRHRWLLCGEMYASKKRSWNNPKGLCLEKEKIIKAMLRSEMYSTKECANEAGDCVPLFGRVGCLYMGDYCAKDSLAWKAMREAYIRRGVWNGIGVFTIPHHGSRHSFTKELTESGDYYIINAGEKNRYKHPHGEVLRCLADEHCLVFGINENLVSGVMFRVYY